MKEGKVKSSNRRLVVLLCMLLVAIVGLGVGIMVVLNISENSLASLVNQKWNDNTSCFEGGTVYDIDLCVVDVYDAEVDNKNIERDDLAVGLYNKAIDVALTNEDYGRARELMVARSNFFVLNENCAKAMELLNNATVDGLNDVNKGIFYSYAAGMSIDCEDEISMAKWDNLLNDYNGGVEGGLGF